MKLSRKWLIIHLLVSIREKVGIKNEDLIIEENKEKTVLTWKMKIIRAKILQKLLPDWLLGY